MVGGTDKENSYNPTLSTKVIIILPYPYLYVYHSYIMCFHKRIIYICGHVGWGAEIVACPQQRAFEEGVQQEECHDMISHPLHSLKVPIMCKECYQRTKRRTRTLWMLEHVKLNLKTLNETLQELKRVEVSTREEARYG